MALTNALLKSMGIEQDQRDQIMSEHRAVTDSIIAERDELRDTAAKVPHLEKEIEELKAAQPAEDWQAKYDELKAEYDGYKAQVDNEKAELEKARLYRSMLREAGVDEKRIDSIMKVTDLSGVGVADGAIADSETVMKAIADEWGDFIVQTNTQGVKVETPPANAGGKAVTRKDIYAKDENGRYKMSTSERQQAIAENLDQFR